MLWIYEEYLCLGFLSRRSLLLCSWVMGLETLCIDLLSYGREGCSCYYVSVLYGASWS